MYTSHFSGIVTLADQYSGMDLLEKVNAILPEVFTLLENSETGITEPNFKSTMLFIAFAYSVESPLIVLGADHYKMKMQVAEKVGLSQKLYQPLIQLKNSNCRSMVLAYLDEQIDRDWRHLLRNKDLYESLCKLQADDIQDEEGKTDYKLVVESAKQLNVLSKEILLLEKELKKKYEKTILSFDEVLPTDKSATSLRIEDFKFVKQ